MPQSNERTRTATSLEGRGVVVAGGTGNVGRHVVGALLRRGARVVVPSRSAAKLADLRRSVGSADEGLVTLVADVADERSAAHVREEITRHLPAGADAVVASLGRWTNAPSLLACTRADLVRVLDDYLIAHFVAARTLLPLVAPGNGSYTLVNGPSASAVWPGSGLVSIATAAQAMLARALADEAAADGVRLAELVIHPSSYIGPDSAAGEGPIDGRAVGRFVAALVAGEVGGRSPLHLDSPEVLAGAP